MICSQLQLTRALAFLHLHRLSINCACISGTGCSAYCWRWDCVVKCVLPEYPRRGKWPTLLVNLLIHIFQFAKLIAQDCIRAGHSSNGKENSDPSIWRWRKDSLLRHKLWLREYSVSSSKLSTWNLSLHWACYARLTSTRAKFTFLRSTGFSWSSQSSSSLPFPI